MTEQELIKTINAKLKHIDPDSTVDIYKLYELVTEDTMEKLISELKLKLENVKIKEVIQLSLSPMSVDRYGGTYIKFGVKQYLLNGWFNVTFENGVTLKISPCWGNKIASFNTSNRATWNEDEILTSSFDYLKKCRGVESIFIEEIRKNDKILKVSSFIDESLLFNVLCESIGCVPKMVAKQQEVKTLMEKLDEIFES